MWASVTPWLVMDAVCVCINHDYLCHMYILIEVTKVISVTFFHYYVCVNYVSDHPLPSPPNRWWQSTSESKENMNW